MPLETLQGPPLPPFVKYHTLPAMSAMAAKLALARKAVAEISKMDDLLERADYEGTVTEDYKNLYLKETARFCVMAFHAVEDAVSMLEGVKADVEAYRREL